MRNPWRDYPASPYLFFCRGKNLRVAAFHSDNRYRISNKTYLRVVQGEEVRDVYLITKGRLRVPNLRWRRDDLVNVDGIVVRDDGLGNHPGDRVWVFPVTGLLKPGNRRIEVVNLTQQRTTEINLSDVMWRPEKMNNAGEIVMEAGNKEKTGRFNEKAPFQPVIVFTVAEPLASRIEWLRMDEVKQLQTIDRRAESSLSNQIKAVSESWAPAPCLTINHMNTTAYTHLASNPPDATSSAIVLRGLIRDGWHVERNMPLVGHFPVMENIQPLPQSRGSLMILEYPYDPAPQELFYQGPGNLALTEGHVSHDPTEPGVVPDSMNCDATDIIANPGLHEANGHTHATEPYSQPGPPSPRQHGADSMELGIKTKQRSPNCGGHLPRSCKPEFSEVPHMHPSRKECDKRWPHECCCVLAIATWKCIQPHKSHQHCWHNAAQRRNTDNHDSLDLPSPPSHNEKGPSQLGECDTTFHTTESVAERILVNSRDVPMLGRGLVNDERADGSPEQHILMPHPPHEVPAFVHTLAPIYELPPLAIPTPQVVAEETWNHPDLAHSDMRSPASLGYPPTPSWPATTPELPPQEIYPESLPAWTPVEIQDYQTMGQIWGNTAGGLPFPTDICVPIDVPMLDPKFPGQYDGMTFTGFSIPALENGCRVYAA